MRDTTLAADSVETPSREPFVTERQAAAFLKISVRTLQRWRVEPPPGGAPRFYKLGAKRVAYRLSDPSRWAETRAFSSTSEWNPSAPRGTGL
ncbi:MAG: hypothetical protein QNJ30_14005 [Kiloniellales bacterium]|nr:hypothetical protein [Kiloniellales bacterium]